MNRQEKELQIKSLKDDFKQSHATFLVGVQGLTVSQIQEMRKNLREQGGEMRVAKNTLSKIASHDFPEMKDLSPYFKRQVALVFAKGESPVVAKVLLDLSKNNEKIDVVVGCFESRIIDRDMIKFLGSLPPRPVLAAQLCGVLNAPAAMVVGLLNQPVVQLLWVLSAAEKKVV